jgi:hypothetical protein
MSRKLDVRWPEETLTKAEGIALGAGVRTAEVLRRAAACGLDEAARALAAERAGKRGERVAAAHAAVAAAGRPSKMPSAGADGSPAVTAGADAPPRPSAPASARVRLDVVVAQALEGGTGRGPMPVSVARARRKIKEAGREPGELVDPAGETGW